MSDAIGQLTGLRAKNLGRDPLALDRLIAPGQELKDETIVRLRKLDNDYLLAKEGLKGTLLGAFACLFVIILIEVLPAFTPRHLVEGWQVVVIVGAMVASVVFYGAFIFDRALRVAAKVGDKAAFLAESDPQNPTVGRERSGGNYELWAKLGPGPSKT